MSRSNYTEPKSFEVFSFEEGTKIPIGVDFNLTLIVFNEEEFEMYQPYENPGSGTKGWIGGFQMQIPSFDPDKLTLEGYFQMMTFTHFCIIDILDLLKTKPFDPDNLDYD